MDIQELKPPSHHTDAPLIDLPRAKPIEDPQAYLRAVVRWHFGVKSMGVVYDGVT